MFSLLFTKSMVVLDEWLRRGKENQYIFFLDFKTAD